MAEYIEREKAFKLIKEQKEKETGAYSKGRNKGLIIAGSIINNKEVLPTSDVVEVKHGEWMHSSRGFDVSGDFECSVCQSPSGIKHFYNGEKYLFCPDCGAKMDGGTG